MENKAACVGTLDATKERPDPYEARMKMLQGPRSLRELPDGFNLRVSQPSRPVRFVQRIAEKLVDALEKR